MTPHALDISVAIIILLSTLAAYFRGIVREFFMLAGLALATFAAAKAGHLLVPDVSKWMDAHPESANEKASVLGGLLTPTIATNAISYGGIFLGVFIVMIIIRMMISHWVSGAGLTMADRIGGAVFGFLRGFILVLVVFATCLYMAYAGKTDELPDWAKNSVSVPILESALAWTDRNIDLQGSLKTVADKIEHVDFDKVKQDAGNAQSDLNAEVKHEENTVQKAVDAPAPAAAPVVPVTSTPMTPASMPSTTPATNPGPGPVPDLAPAPTPAAPAPAAAGKATP